MARTSRVRAALCFVPLKLCGCSRVLRFCIHIGTLFLLLLHGSSFDVLRYQRTRSANDRAGATLLQSHRNLAPSLLPGLHPGVGIEQTLILASPIHRSRSSSSETTICIPPPFAYGYACRYFLHNFEHQPSFSLSSTHTFASYTSQCRSRLGSVCASCLLSTLSTCPCCFIFFIFSYLPSFPLSLLEHITHIIHSILHLYPNILVRQHQVHFTGKHITVTRL
jgi:hypothetical protein